MTCVWSSSPFTSIVSPRVSSCSSLSLSACHTAYFARLMLLAISVRFVRVLRMPRTSARSSSLICVAFPFYMGMQPLRQNKCGFLATTSTNGSLSLCSMTSPSSRTLTSISAMTWRQQSRAHWVRASTSFRNHKREAVAAAAQSSPSIGSCHSAKVYGPRA